MHIGLGTYIAQNDFQEAGASEFPRPAGMIPDFQRYKFNRQILVHKYAHLGSDPIPVMLKTGISNAVRCDIRFVAGDRVR